MDYVQHRNYGLAVALSVAIGYYAFFTANYYSQVGVLLYSQKLFEYSLLLFIVTLAGSLSPDLDTASKPSRYAAIFLSIWIGLVLFSGKIIQYLNLETELHWKPALIAAFVYILCKAGKHRGITHRLLWVPVLIGLGLYTDNHGLIAFAIGLSTHYYCDSINPLVWKNWV